MNKKLRKKQMLPMDSLAVEAIQRTLSTSLLNHFCSLVIVLLDHVSLDDIGGEYMGGSDDSSGSFSDDYSSASFEKDC